MRITKHSVISIEDRQQIRFKFNGTELLGMQGDTVASSLWTMKIKVLRDSEKKGESRGIYCGIGNCYDCRIHLNGFGMVRACITPIKEGMELYSVDKGDVPT